MNGFWKRILRLWNAAADTAEGDAGPRRPLIFRHPILFGTIGALACLSVGVFLYVYLQYAKLIEGKLGDGGMRTNSTIYASPKVIAPGDAMTIAELVTHLQSGGYTDQSSNPIGWYRNTPQGIEITSGSASYFQPHTAVVTIANNKVARIYSRTEDRTATHFWLEPELVTNLFDGQRGKRRPLPLSELPKNLINALIAIEDKRFFNHGGLDLLRLGKAVYVDLKERRKEQGASTLTMQLARSFWLDQDKTLRRKAAELFLAAELERRFSKEKILELYANEVYPRTSRQFQHSRVRRSGSRLFRKGRSRANPARGGHACRYHPASRLFQSF